MGWVTTEALINKCRCDPGSVPQRLCVHNLLMTSVFAAPIDTSCKSFLWRCRSGLSHRRTMGQHLVCGHPRWQDLALSNRAGPRRPPKLDEFCSLGHFILLQYSGGSLCIPPDIDGLIYGAFRCAFWGGTAHLCRRTAPGTIDISR